MPLVTSKEMFEKAYKGGYAIGAFNVNNMEIIQGITGAASKLNAPVILQVSKGARAYANRTYLMKLVEAAVIETGLPICLHLDHGDSFELCKSCIDDGFTSVMIDASSKPFAENIALTRQVVEYAHDHGVVVESLSVPATVLTSSSPVLSPSCALMCWRRWRRSFPASPSCCMAPPPCPRNLWRKSTSTAAICPALSAYRRISCARLHPWLYVRLTLTLTCVWP